MDGQLEGIDFLNVTDCALAKMRFSALPFGSILKSRYGLEPLVNVSCRDRNLIALQADLLAGWAQGVQSVVALTGDAVTVGDDPERKGVFEVNSIGLLNCVAALNAGHDVAGHELKGAPNFTAGVVVNPNARNPDAELRRLEKKKNAGAKYALSQPVFDLASATEFFRKAVSAGVPAFVGLLPLKSIKSAEAVAKVPGIRIDASFVERLQQSGSDDLSALSLDLCLQIAEATRPFVAGFHVVSGATPGLALKLAQRLVSHFKR